LVIYGLFEIIMCASFIIILLFYVSYSALLLYFNKLGRRRKKISNYTYPTVTLIVPVYNEEAVIARKIQNIEGINYPHDKMEVIFVDGCSTDRTSQIILEHAQKSEKSFRLIKQDKRKGYTYALIEGIENSQSEIIVATDAASYYYPDAVLNLVRHFADSKIGAVTGKEVVLGKEGDSGPSIEKSYRFFYDFMRAAETEMDSTPDSKGEILAVRKEICGKLLGKLVLSPNASFDSCVPYQAKLMGYRTIFDEEALYWEAAPASFSDRMKQQVRRATLLIGGMLLFKGILFDKKSDMFDMLILPAHLIMECVLPSVFVLGAIAFLVLTIINPLTVAPIWIILLLSLAFRKSRLFIFWFVQAQFALVAALFKLAKREETLFIKSIPSTRTVT
jgi:biofilm PGA synthesis N-glycosyltransferase PgaC